MSTGAVLKRWLRGTNVEKINISAFAVAVVARQPPHAAALTAACAFAERGVGVLSTNVTPFIGDVVREENLTTKDAYNTNVTAKECHTTNAYNTKTSSHGRGVQPFVFWRRYLAGLLVL